MIVPHSRQVKRSSGLSTGSLLPRSVVHLEMMGGGERKLTFYTIARVYAADGKCITTDGKPDAVDGKPTAIDRQIRQK